MTRKITNKSLVIIVLFLAVTAGGYWLYNLPDTRSDSERLGDALGEISKGFENAGKELENQTLGQRLNDDIRSAAQEIKDEIKSNAGAIDENVSK